MFSSRRTAAGVGKAMTEERNLLFLPWKPWSSIVGQRETNQKYWNNKHQFPYAIVVQKQKKKICEMSSAGANVRWTGVSTTNCKRIKSERGTKWGAELYFTYIRRDCEIWHSKKSIASNRVVSREVSHVTVLVLWLNYLSLSTNVVHFPWRW